MEWYEVQEEEEEVEQGGVFGEPQAPPPPPPDFGHLRQLYTTDVPLTLDAAILATLRRHVRWYETQRDHKTVQYLFHYVSLPVPLVATRTRSDPNMLAGVPLDRSPIDTERLATQFWDRQTAETDKDYEKEAKGFLRNELAVWPSYEEAHVEAAREKSTKKKRRMKPEVVQKVWDGAPPLGYHAGQLTLWAADEDLNRLDQLFRDDVFAGTAAAAATTEAQLWQVSRSENAIEKNNTRVFLSSPANAVLGLPQMTDIGIPIKPAPNAKGLKKMADFHKATYVVVQTVDRDTTALTVDLRVAYRLLGPDARVEVPSGQETPLGKRSAFLLRYMPIDDNTESAVRVLVRALHWAYNVLVFFLEYRELLQQQPSLVQQFFAEPDTPVVVPGQGKKRLRRRDVAAHLVRIGRLVGVTVNRLLWRFERLLRLYFRVDSSPVATEKHWRAFMVESELPKRYADNMRAIVGGQETIEIATAHLLLLYVLEQELLRLTGRSANQYDKAVRALRPVPQLPPPDAGWQPDSPLLDLPKEFVEQMKQQLHNKAEEEEEEEVSGPPPAFDAAYLQEQEKLQQLPEPPNIWDSVDVSEFLDDADVSGWPLPEAKARRHWYRVLFDEEI